LAKYSLHSLSHQPVLTLSKLSIAPFTVPACRDQSLSISKEQTQIQALENVESVAVEYVCLIVWETLPQWQSHRFLDKESN